jgi:hypothetical protein
MILFSDNLSLPCITKEQSDCVFAGFAASREALIRCWAFLVVLYMAKKGADTFFEKLVSALHNRGAVRLRLRRLHGFAGRANSGRAVHG